MTSGGTPVLKSHESDPKNLNAFNTQESWGGGGGGGVVHFLSLFYSLRHLILEKNIHITFSDFMTMKIKNFPLSLMKVDILM